MKTKYLIIIIVSLVIILGGVICLYFFFPINNNNIPTNNFKDFGDFGNFGKIDTSNWAYEEYIFEEKEDDTLDTNNKVTISLENTVSINGTGASSKNGNVYISAGGEYTISGTFSGSIIIDTENKVQLNLNGVNISSTNTSAINVVNAKKVIINLVDGTDNYLKDSGEYAENANEKATLFSNDALKIKGNGNLNVTGNYKHAICSDDYIIVESGNIVVSATKDGFHANDHIQIDGGKITVNSAHDGIESEGGIIINNGTITVSSVEDDGITAQNTVIINNGTIEIKSCVEGIESKNNIIINDGKINVVGTDDGLNATYDITINGGNINCNISKGDGIDSNGSLNINGGEIITAGSQMPEGGIDNDNNTFAITGGTLIATGGTNSTPTSSSCTQNCIMLGSMNAGSTLKIVQNGNTVITYTTQKSYSNLLLSSNKLETGKEYIVYVDDTEQTTFTISEAVTNVNGTSQNMGGGGMQPGGIMPQDGNMEKRKNK